MAWCPYCRRYTVNGRCPNCNRMYTEPNKNYDFYGKEIKSSSNSSGGSATFTSTPYFWPGFWLGIAINFGAILIAKYKNRKMLKGAIVGTILNSVFTLHIITILIYTILIANGVQL